VHQTPRMQLRTGKGATAPLRIVGVDVARCLALVGMMATHVLPLRDDDGSLTLTHQVAGGRASALFAVLAGLSLALMSGGREPGRGADRTKVTLGLVVRALLIALVGLFLGGLWTNIAVILTYYGVLFLLAVPFIGLRARTLAVLGGTWLLVVPVLSHLVRPNLPPRGFDSPRFSGLGDPWQMISELTFTGYYPAVPWLGYLLVGMAVGRTDLHRWRSTWVLVPLGAALAGASWLGSEMLLRQTQVQRALLDTAPEPGMAFDQLRRVLEEGTYGTTPTGSGWWLAVHAPHAGTPFDLVHTTGTAMLVIGLCLAVGRLWPGTSAVVFGAGAMTLSLYTLHVVLRTPRFLPDDDPLTLLRHVMVALVLGATFRLLAWRGPLEATTRLLGRWAGKAAGGTAETRLRSRHGGPRIERTGDSG